MDYKNILLKVTDHIALITFNRPDKLNALNHETLVELKSVFEKIKSDFEKKMYSVSSQKKMYFFCYS